MKLNKDIETLMKQYNYTLCAERFWKSKRREIAKSINQIMQDNEISKYESSKGDLLQIRISGSDDVRITSSESRKNRLAKNASHCARRKRNISVLDFMKSRKDRV